MIFDYSYNENNNDKNVENDNVENKKCDHHYRLYKNVL